LVSMNLMDVVRALEKRARGARKAWIIGYLKRNGIPYTSQSYETGENIIVPSPSIFEVGIGSHFDAVEGSPGANDNASAVAVTLGVLERFTLDPPNNVGIRYFFFDEEENGLRGSHAYVREFGIDGLLGVYNMELVGRGTNAASWSVGPVVDTEFLRIFEDAASSAGVTPYRFDRIAMNTADHMSFLSAGLRSSFTITMISNEDLCVGKEFYAALQRHAPPGEVLGIVAKAPLFRDYHTPNDTSASLQESSMQNLVNILCESIERIDDLLETEDAYDAHSFS
jgi:Zn-dependent M28 family amino/carboxypeptidase